MGTKVIPPIVGVNCANWDPPDETPNHIYCMFYDVKKGDRFGAVEPPNLHVFKMEQVDGQPCLWRHENASFGWLVEFGLAVGASWLYLRDTTPQANLYFADETGSSPVSEYELFTNVYQAPAGNWGYIGHGIIFWSDPFVLLPGLLGIDHADDLMLEIFSDQNNNIFVKYCSLSLHLNITVKFSR